MTNKIKVFTLKVIIYALIMITLSKNSFCTERKDTLTSRSSLSINLLAPFFGEIQLDYRHILINNKFELSLKPKISLSPSDHALWNENKIQPDHYSIPVGLNYNLSKHFYTGVYIAPYFTRNFNRLGMIDIYPVIGLRWKINKKIIITSEIGYGLSYQYFSDIKKYTSEINFCHLQLGLGILLSRNKNK